jgi:rhamnulokinase
VITPQTLAADFTNEGGVAGTTRLLMNIGGMWPLQECRRAWAAEGHDYTYPELMAAASDDASAFLSLFDPDDPRLLHPPHMPRAIADYCRDTGQRQPDTPGAYARAILESLAFKYRVVLDMLEELTGGAITEIQIIGGGSRNRLLNQFTADATGRSVVAGPVEATALGNIAVQMVATGEVASIAHARTIIERSFPTERAEPRHADLWDAHAPRFKQYVEQV